MLSGEAQWLNFAGSKQITDGYSIVGNKERFNIEASGEGLSCFEDEHCRSWPHKITDQELKAGLFLKSLTPVEEFAEFLAARGHCLEAIGRLPEAEIAYALAHRLAPQNPRHLGYLYMAIRKELAKMQGVTR